MCNQLASQTSKWGRELSFIPSQEASVITIVSSAYSSVGVVCGGHDAYSLQPSPFQSWKLLSALLTHHGGLIAVFQAFCLTLSRHACLCVSGSNLCNWKHQEISIITMIVVVVGSVGTTE